MTGYSFSMLPSNGAHDLDLEVNCVVANIVYVLTVSELTLCSVRLLPKWTGYAIPAVNCVSSSGINACLEAARKNDAPIIIQFSSGGSQVSLVLRIEGALAWSESD
jgi:hypothetical protein